MARLTSSIYIGNTSIVVIDGLADADGAYQNDATVTVESMVDQATETSVPNVTLPIAMSYVSGTNGRYEGLIPYNATLVEREWYTLTIRAVSAIGNRGEWIEQAEALYREA